MNYPYLNFMKFNKQLTPEEQAVLDAQNGVSGISGLSLQMPETISAGIVAPPIAKKTEDNGLGLEGKDYLNLGLMVGQGIIDEKEAERERERQKEETKRLEGRENKAFMYNAQQDAIRNQQQDRSQNLQGLNYLADQRNQARASAKSGAFRSALARAMRGGK